MTERKKKPGAGRVQVYFNKDQRAGIETLRERDGASLQHTVSRAVDEYLERQGVLKKAR